MIGKNLANPSIDNNVNKSFNASVQKSQVCIFLSYTSEDRNTVKKIGEYIQDAGFDIYLDIYDESLQRAVSQGDPIAITKNIEKGLSVSTNVFCIVSEKTVGSWWVPYEIGFGKRADKPLATLTLKDTITIPSYLEITRIIRGTRSLNDYLNELSKKSNLLFESASTFIGKNPYSMSQHPLDNYLSWKE
ncbi:toll/interleukin-1 receptor domain-containing protein [uncultured Paenibacillus sp.]|uniref:toll/interleukin-1 receptor domain-containing protein n=1 Tax=uncultured Paenibacillus sp. TaxID=227322 RepID=UPI002804ADDE|nr:toll/interleukin-1 receptor domain-containing protein [uncultured Paenibacillus sp.]